MDALAILKIEDKFVLGDGRCYVMPDFPLSEGLLTPVSVPAEISGSDGKARSCILHLEVTHFNIPASTDVNRRWRLTPRLSGIDPDDISIGDTLRILDTDIVDALLGHLAP